MSLLRSPLHDEHVALGATLVPFAGWEMPVRYTGDIAEHTAVRTAAGLFDLSHMGEISVRGDDAAAFLEHALVGRLSAVGLWGARYTMMCTPEGGVVDDLIVYRLDDGNYRLVVNAATREKDLEWIRRHAQDFGVHVNERAELAMIAVQGPQARELAATLIDAHWREQALALAPFSACYAGEWFVARTGYTGEDGWEILLPAADAAEAWAALLEAGVAPCGLGARDTLRLEAAMNLYGNDMDESVSPLESGLEWTVAWEPADRDFIGRAALEQQKASGGLRRFVGLLLEDKGILRGHQRVVVDGAGDGEITSGGYSPTLDRSIALARVPAGVQDRAKVDIRGRLAEARIVPTPFVRYGKVRIDV